MSRYMKAPIRFLSKAKDMYIQGMTHCSEFAYVDAAMICPTVPATPVSTLPRSFSVGSATSSSGNRDYRDLVRSASVKAVNDHHKFQRSTSSQVPRTRIAKIDEEKVSDFKKDDADDDNDNDKMGKKPLVFGRSKSYSVQKRVWLF